MGPYELLAKLVRPPGFAGDLAGHPETAGKISFAALSIFDNNLFIGVPNGLRLSIRIWPGSFKKIVTGVSKSAAIVAKTRIS